MFQEKYESYINSLTETLLVLKNKVETQGLKKEIFENLLKEKENGLKALLALTGFANESLKRLVTVLRVSENKELSTLLYKSKWAEEGNNAEIIEWTDTKIAKLLADNVYFRKGIINLFFEGSTIPYLTNTLPLFELKKLSISKLQFNTHSLLDTLVRYKEKGSYSGKADNNPEKLISSLIKDCELTSEKGDLTELFKKEKISKRTMDFIIPNKINPKVIIESSFLVTTSSGQGDKSKTEGTIKRLIRKYYPKAKFIGFVDGIGWYVRKGDLARMVSAYDDVFTFHKDEVERFKQFLKSEFQV
ncbi:MAG: hypothetical protein FD188_905 [Ignavibacteria bacterium]|nr:MAG: hypothetical protein FD188_905 [Ignavibacteria bacterium]